MYRPGQSFSYKWGAGGNIICLCLTGVLLWPKNHLQKTPRLKAQTFWFGLAVSVSCHLHKCIARPSWEQLGFLSMKTEGGGGSLHWFKKWLLLEQYAVVIMNNLLVLFIFGTRFVFHALSAPAKHFCHFYSVPNSIEDFMQKCDIIRILQFLLWFKQ
jgi:hypothetical protein